MFPATALASSPAMKMKMMCKENIDMPVMFGGGGGGGERKNNKKKKKKKG